MEIYVNKKVILILGLLFSLFPYSKAAEKVDSLKAVLNTAKHVDSVKVELLTDISWELKFQNGDSAILYAEKALQIAQKNENFNQLAKCYNTIGVIYTIQSNYDLAVPNYKKSIEYRKKINDEKSMVGTYNNLGNLNAQQGNMKAALDYYFKALKINEKFKNKPWIANNYNNIGLVFAEQKDFKKSLDYHFKCIKVREELGDSIGKGTCLNNIGLVYKDMGAFDSALYFFNYSLKLIDTNNVYEYANAINNIGLIHFEKGQFVKALEHYKIANEKRKLLGNKESMAASLINIGSALIELERFNEALEYNLNGLQLSEEIGVKLWIKNAHLNLSLNYEALGDFEKSLKHQKEFSRLKDSLFNDERTKFRVKAEMEYQFEKEKDLMKIEQEKKLLIERKENERQFLILIFTITGSAVVIILLLIIYRRLQITKKQKLIIEEQKEEVETQRDVIDQQKQEVEEVHQEIKDSIVYAKRIQEAILPSISSMKDSLKNAFVLYKPRDIVAGDFYWMEVYDGKVYVAAADCTGHGVPGAMISVVCSNALSKSLLEEKITDVGKLLDNTREIVVARLSKSGDDVKDGMDISLACIDFNTMNMDWAGANNPLYLIREGNIEITKGHRESIGQTDNQTPFTKHKIALKKGDNIYLFTDGFADQFGGPSGRKMGYNRFREKLIEISTEPINDQQIILSSFFDEWRASEEQLDDVCVIGIKL